MCKTTFIESARKFSKLMINNYADGFLVPYNHTYGIDYPKVLEQRYLKTNLGLYRGIVFFYGYALSHLYSVDTGWDDYTDQPMTSEKQGVKDDREKKVIWHFLLSDTLKNLVSNPADTKDRHKVFTFLEKHHTY